MKHVGLLLLLVILTYDHIWADEEGNVYWTLDQSPILVQNNVLIPSGSILSIEAGTEVLFAKGIGIVIKGRIRTVNDGKAYLKGESTSLWKGVEFQTEEEFTVENLHISNASQAIKLVSSDKVTISNNVLENNTYGVVLMVNDGNRGRVNSILDNQIRNNVTGVSVNSTGANLERNIIADNQSYGVNLTGGSCGAGSACGWSSSLSNNLVSGSDIAIRIYGHNFVCKNNDIYNSTVGISVRNLRNTTYSIDNNNVVGWSAYALINENSDDLNAGNIWLGQTDIAKSICDITSNISRGKVDIIAGTERFPTNHGFELPEVND